MGTLEEEGIRGKGSWMCVCGEQLSMSATDVQRALQVRLGGKTELVAQWKESQGFLPASGKVHVSPPIHPHSQHRPVAARWRWGCVTDK